LDFDKPCGGGVKYRLFSEFDIPEEPIFKKIDRVKLNFQGEEIEVNLGGPKLALVERRRFDALLRQLAEEEGVKIVEGRVRRVNSHRGKFTLEVERGEERELITGDILVGADGVNSTIRKLLLKERLPMVTTCYGTISTPVEVPTFYFDREVGGSFYSWAFPHPTGGHIGSPSPALFRRFVKEYFSPFHSPVKGYNIPLWNGNISIQKGNLFFVGDAGGQVMPTTFEGIYYAVASGRLLARGLGEGLSYPTLWQNRFLREFKFMKMVEKGLNSRFRYRLLSLFRWHWYQKLVVKIWNKEF
jgi:geranylgeranyl reductase